MNTLTGSV